MSETDTTDPIDAGNLPGYAGTDTVQDESDPSQTSDTAPDSFLLDSESKRFINKQQTQRVVGTRGQFLGYIDEQGDLHEVVAESYDIATSGEFAPIRSGVDTAGEQDFGLHIYHITRRLSSIQDDINSINSKIKNINYTSDMTEENAGSKSEEMLAMSELNNTYLAVVQIGFATLGLATIAISLTTPSSTLGTIAPFATPILFALALIGVFVEKMNNQNGL